MKRVLPWLALLLSANTPALQVIDLSWREANDIAAALRPQLRPGESLSGLDNKLIIDADASREAQLAALARQLDVQPASLQVEVEQQGSTSSGQTTLGARGSITIGNVTLNNSGSTRSNGVTIYGQQAQQNGSSNNRQSLRLLDGRSGFIQTVNSRPLPWRMVTAQGNIVRGSSYQDAITGFYARPRLAGNRVIIELAASQQAFSGKNINGNSLSTTVEGTLGKWIEVGSIGRDEQGQDSLLLGRGNTQQQGSQRIRIRINTAP